MFFFSVSRDLVVNLKVLDRKVCCTPSVYFNITASSETIRFVDCGTQVSRSFGTRVFVVQIQMLSLTTRKNHSTTCPINGAEESAPRSLFQRRPGLAVDRCICCTAYETKGKIFLVGVGKNLLELYRYNQVLDKVAADRRPALWFFSCCLACTLRWWDLTK